MEKEKSNMVEVNEDRRSFVGPDEETEYFISTPSAEDIRGADWQYSKTYTRCLNEGIVTSAEMTDILKRRGIIGNDYNMRVRELQNELNRRILALNDSTDNENKADLAVQVAECREELFQWNQRLSGPMSNTCEQISDDARLEYLTACIIEDKEGNRVWPEYEDFLAVKDQSLSMKARYEVMLFLQGYSSDFLEQTPEARAMKEIEAEIISKAAQEAADELEEEDKAKKEDIDSEPSSEEKPIADEKPAVAKNKPAASKKKTKSKKPEKSKDSKG
jgi:hypothetical protein